MYVCVPVVQQMMSSVSCQLLVVGYTRHVLSCRMDQPLTTPMALVVCLSLLVLINHHHHHHHYREMVVVDLAY